jgi:hypothetical protein
MNKQNWLLIYLYLPAADNYVLKDDAIRIQYSLFFFYMENKTKLGEFYSFEPYLYGPNSLDIFKDLRELQGQGLIASGELKKLDYYWLTSEGEIKAKELIEFQPLVNKLAAIKWRTTEFTFLQLLKLIYIKYPKYARNSLVGMEILNDINCSVEV